MDGAFINNSALAFHYDAGGKQQGCGVVLEDITVPVRCIKADTVKGKARKSFLN